MVDQSFVQQVEDIIAAEQMNEKEALQNLAVIMGDLIDGDPDLYAYALVQVEQAG